MAERITVIMACTTCKDRNYTFSRGKRKEYKVEVKKFCKRCGKSVAHKEMKAS
jgi:large subunit ribosomal protein L33